MILKSFNINYSNIIHFYFDKNETNYQPYFLKRVTADIWKYNSAEIAIENNDNDYSLDLNKLFDLLNPYKEEVFDLYLYKTKIGYKKSIVFEQEDFKEQKLQIKNDFCDMKLTLYKNGSKGFSIKVVCENLNTFKIKFLSEDKNSIKLEVSTDFQNPYQIMLARRSTFLHENKYDFFVELDQKNNIITLNKKNLVNNVQKDGETYDFVAKVNEKLFTFISDESFKTEYFENDDEYSAKLFLSEKKFAGIYLKRTGPKTQKKIKVAVLGSCFSREVFHSIDFFNEDYKKFYEVGLTGFHQSFIDIMSKPINYDPKDLESSDDKTLKIYGKDFLEKTFLQKIVQYKPQYLIIDTYVDNNAKIIDLKNGSYITRVFYLENTDFIKKINTDDYYAMNSAERFELYKKSVSEFISFMNKNLPKTKIIILRAHLTTKKKEDNIISSWDKDKLDYILYEREIADKNNDYLVSQLPSAKIIDMRGDNFYTDKKAPMSFGPSHMNSEYYKEVLNKFNKIVLQDILKGDIRL